MRRYYLCIFSIILSLPVFSQSERVFLHTDKLVCYPSDTIWFRGYIFNDTTTASSTTIYAELWDDSSRLITRKMFLAFKGAALGYMEVPEQCGSYWLRGYTRNAKGYTLLPVTIRDKTNKVPFKILKIDELPIRDSLIALIKDTDGYHIRINEKISCNYSLSIVDANIPTYPPVIIDKPIFPGGQFDTSFLSYSGKLYGWSRQERKKKYITHYLVLIVKKDTIVPLPQTVTIDSNSAVSFSGLNFFGISKVQYQVNHTTNPNIQLIMDAKRYPTFYAPTAKITKKDTVMIPYRYDSIAGYRNAKSLKEVIVKANWRAYNDALDKRYVMDKKWFSGYVWSQDLRDSFTMRQFSTIQEFFDGNPGLKWGIHAARTFACNEGVHWYIDEKPVTGEWLFKENVINYAYIKTFMDGMCPGVCIYTRKGSDWEGIPGRMGTVIIKGYDNPLKWQSPDRTTLLWEPYITENLHKLPKLNKSVRITIMGVTNTGAPIYSTSILPL